VTRVTFDYIKQHPGLTGGEVSRALVAQGYKQGSTSSVMTQMLYQGQLRRDDERKLYTSVDNYIPIKRHLNAKTAVVKFKSLKPTKAKAPNPPEPAKVKPAKVKPAKYAFYPVATEIKPATDVGVMLSTMSKICKLYTECLEEICGIDWSGLIDPEQIHHNLPVFFCNFTISIVRIIKKIF
jgi:hypothetical protein